MPLSLLTTGNPPNEINVIIEISEGSSVKYEIDKDSGFLMVDRFVHTAMVFPFNYGFLPHSLSEDGDPLDVLVISELPVVPGCVISARPIGILEMEDESGKDAKIIAVPRKKVDPWYADIEDITDLDEPTQRKIHHFFNHYKSLEDGKWVKVTGTFGRDRAREEILECIARAKETGVDR